MMTNHSLYSLLTLDFWIKRVCSQCQQGFTPTDYQVQNYQLTFTEVLKIDQLNLEVQVQLSHKSCCANCTNYLYDKKKKTPSINRNH